MLSSVDQRGFELIAIVNRDAAVGELGHAQAAIENDFVTRGHVAVSFSKN
jgi:hypothetical protein